MSRVLRRAFSIWLAIVALESLHGAARVAWLEPRLGDFRARQVCVLTGMALIFAVSLLAIRWLAPRSSRAAFEIGASWLGLTLAFEFALGRFVAGYTWERLLEDYDLSRGGLLGIGMAFLAAAPWLAARVRHIL